MQKILVLHGPNLNLLGTRKPDIYGNMALEEINIKMIEAAGEWDLEVRTFQSNGEGELINALHDAKRWASGVIFNPGGYTHTSVALHDAISAIGLPVIEVHLSNIYAREPFRRISMIAPACVGTIAGFGWRSYLLGIQALINIVVE